MRENKGIQQEVFIGCNITSWLHACFVKTLVKEKQMINKGPLKCLCSSIVVPGRSM